MATSTLMVSLAQANAELVSTEDTESRPGYVIRKFTAGSGEWTVPAGVSSLEILVVGGGGGSGGNVGAGNGGGGGGGFYENLTYTGFGASLNISVGAGGAMGANGASSSLDGFIAYGGQAGGITGGNSGGNNQGGTVYTGGIEQGGGAGAGENGNGYWFTTPPGGDGLASSITGTATYYGGGGGGVDVGGPLPNGGLGGGGSGGYTGDVAGPATAGVDGLGGGGGSDRITSASKGGGSGVVIIAYAAAISSPYDQWIGSYTALTGNDTLPEADPDGDGMNNFQEFAFGLVPTNSASCNPISDLSNLATGKQFIYTRRINTGLNYTIWGSSDLQDWGTQALTADQDAVNLTGDKESILVTLPDLPETKMFFRVKAD